MATHIKTWQIVEDKLQLIETSLSEQGRLEANHMETWIASEPAILGADVALIGRQVATQSGPLDFLGIDKNGSTVINPSFGLEIVRNSSVFMLAIQPSQCN